MRQWYCVVQGQRYGPVAENVLRDWMREGRVLPSDLVWTEGMPDWAPAGSLFADIFPPGAFAAAGYPTWGLVAVPAPDGTRGATPNGELTAQARALLAGRWGLPIAFCLLVMLISFAVNMVPYAGAVASLILDGPFQLGLIVFFLTFVRGGRCDLGMLFIGFRRFGRAVGAYLLVVVVVLGWTLLSAALGGIVALVAALSDSEELIAVGVLLGIVSAVVVLTVTSLMYSQTMFLVADNDQLRVVDALGRSRRLMDGLKLKLWCLGWRFFGWALLCLLTLGIGFLWLIPYVNTAYARFYDDLQPPRQQAAQPPQGEIGQGP